MICKNKRIYLSNLNVKITNNNTQLRKHISVHCVYKSRTNQISNINYVEIECMYMCKKTAKTNHTKLKTKTSTSQNTTIETSKYLHVSKK